MQGSDAVACRVIRGSLSEKVIFDGRNKDTNYLGRKMKLPSRENSKCIFPSV